MENLPSETINTVFSLQRQLLQLIHETIVTEFTISERFGETKTTLTALEQLQNVRERARGYYARLYRLLLQIAESIRVSSATMDLLEQSIEETEVIADAGQATITETKKDFNLS